MPDGQQHQQARHRAADPDEVDGPARCKQRHRQRSAELDGHRNAERNRFQRQVEQHVHHAQRHAVARHHPPVMPRHAVPPRASEQDQHQGREQQPQCRGALRAHNGEDLLGQRGAQRQRRHRAQQPQDGLQGKGRRGICRRLGRSSRSIHEGESRIRERERAHAWALHDKEDDADPVRRGLAARPPSGVCCRSDDTQLSVPSRFTDGNGVAHSRLSDVPGEGAAVMPRCSWAGGQKSSYNARHAGVAQLVERRLPKPEVASSRLVARSTFPHRRHHRVGGHGVQVHGQHRKGP